MIHYLLSQVMVPAQPSLEVMIVSLVREYRLVKSNHRAEMANKAYYLLNREHLYIADVVPHDYVGMLYKQSNLLQNVFIPR